MRRQGKGNDRPINRQDDQLAWLAAQKSVTPVTVFDSGMRLDLVLTVHLDVLVKGGDWAPDRIAGAPEVTAWGGSVHSIPFRHPTSTTALLARIRT